MTGNAVPVFGLAYLASPLSNFLDLFRAPLHCLFYIPFIAFMCSFFSSLRIRVSGQGPRDVSRQLQAKGLHFSGSRDNNTLLKYYINTAASFGGLFVAGLCLVSDLMGAIGSGIGIMLACTSIIQIFEEVAKERERYVNTGSFFL